jgi:hypothetical protein
MAGKGLRIGYVRVSSYDQNESRQLEHMDTDRIFTDKASGKDAERPQLQELLSYAREGAAQGHRTMFVSPYESGSCGLCPFGHQNVTCWD